MKKKLYLQSYFLINNNKHYEHSMGIRFNYVGLNVMLVGIAYSVLFFGNLRAKAAKGEKFN